ncbi:membrane-spanning 4-domains subfamily A member 4A-like [Melanotaenia boesemani]|uniref:membrane-spanning 4-domains subfamily A member 4A-like n=1 Tax=Melanotaenia boesemani TaxID=1250792 RepID=UPI001C054535|nr:membrane-spanning 4-domains subfamily A member 4A-like [Melanotaenia boesemani]
MASTSVTTVGGVMIVTQVIPKGDSSIPLESVAASVEQTPPPVMKTTPPATVTPSTSTKTDTEAASPLQVEPQCLGVAQIFVGLLCVLFSLTAVYTRVLILYAPFSLGAIFVVSGTLAVAAGRRTSVGLVWTSLMFNITSVLLGLAGLIYLCLLMATTPPSEMFCGFQTYNIDWMRRCVGKLWMLDRALYGLLGLLLVLLVLQVCVSVTVCVISGRVIKRHNRYTPIKVETDDDRTLLDPQHSSEHNLHAQSP